MRHSWFIATWVFVALFVAGCSPVTQKSDVGIQLFMYNWNSVAKECEESLGPSGFSWVLVSPPQEHIDQKQWWVHFQPVSYKIESRLGTRDDFKKMVETCNRAGVEVIADAVINHMAGSSSGTGWAGSTYDKYNYPGIYQADDFHQCGLTENNQILNFGDRNQVQKCELLGLSDLDTSSVKVQNQLIDYLNDLLSLGISGFRIDAAKHIAAEDLKAIIRGLPDNTIILQEVIRGSGEEVQPEEYLATGKLWEFGYSELVTSFDYGIVPNLDEAISLGSYLDSDSAISFVTNHDTERNGKALTQQFSPQAFELATIFLLASDYGTPMLYSGFFFDEYDQPPPLSDSGEVLDADCNLSEIWHCQQRQDAIVAMIYWRSKVLEQPVVNFSHEESFSSWSKGDKGFFAINGSLSTQIRKVQTRLPAGQYCNILETTFTKMSCSSSEITVQSDGTIELELKPMTAVALLRN